LGQQQSLNSLSLDWMPSASIGDLISNNWLLSAAAKPDFEQALNTFDELKTTGNLEIFRDKDLREAIV
jgi:hypothetical protein